MASGLLQEKIADLAVRVALIGNQRVENRIAGFGRLPVRQTRKPSGDPMLY
jgi:hypothetical protein